MQNLFYRTLDGALIDGPMLLPAGPWRDPATGDVIPSLLALDDAALAALPGSAWVRATTRPEFLAWLAAERRAAINAERDALEAGGFPYLGHRLDSDERSVKRMIVKDAEARSAMAAGQPISVDWVCADNTVLTMDAAGILGMLPALAAHAAALHAAARAAKEQIDAILAADPPMPLADALAAVQAVAPAWS